MIRFPPEFRKTMRFSKFNDRTFMDSGGGATGNGGSKYTLIGGEVDLDGGISSGIEDLSRKHFLDAHLVVILGEVPNSRNIPRSQE